MSRRFFIWSFFLLSVLGISLFHVKYKVVDLENKLNKVNAKIFACEEDLHLLNVEWVYLTSPRRLNQLVDKYLKMDFYKADQIDLGDGKESPSRLQVKATNLSDGGVQ